MGRYYLSNGNSIGNTFYVNTLSCFHEVDSETVCEYTGCKDKDGEKIFEGDILQIIIKDWQDGRELTKANEAVEFNDCEFGIIWGMHRNFEGLNTFSKEVTTFEVIGNKWDNPELLNN